MGILVITEHDNQSIKTSTLNSVTAAGQLGDDITLLVAGKDSQSVAEAAKSIAGVTRVLHVDADQYQQPLAEELAPLVVSLGSGSSGNSLFIEFGGTCLLVDTGFSAAETARRLHAIGVE